MMTKRIYDQIMKIRDLGETNMLDVRTVQYIANREGYYELVIYLEDERMEYWKFIMTGEAPMEEAKEAEDEHKEGC